MAILVNLAAERQRNNLLVKGGKSKKARDAALRQKSQTELGQRPTITYEKGSCVIESHLPH
ncbi:MAG: hypothetical protein V3V32_00590 [Dehalococcoidia bacterium]